MNPSVFCPNCKDEAYCEDIQYDVYKADRIVITITCEGCKKWFTYEIPAIKLNYDPERYRIKETGDPNEN